MASRLSGKQRAARIPLDYYRSRDGLSRWKLRLSALAVVVVGAWWLSGLSLGGPGLVGESARGRMRYSHGPLARVHAAWDAKCDACHVSFRPIGEDAWPNRLGLTSSGADAKCQACHAVESHHADTLKPPEGSCASCHRDHEGRDASLVRLADAACLTCHGDLSKHAKPGLPAEDVARIAAFAKSVEFPAKHEEFRLMQGGADAATDPGTLKFNHALHLSAGLNEAKGGKPVLTLDQLSPADQEKYRRHGQDLKDGVLLDCASCHRLENGDRPSLASRSGVQAHESRPIGGTGAYMKPISYKSDCAACHKLDVTVPRGDGHAVASVTLPVPHRLQPADLHEMLTNASIGISLGKDDAALKEAVADVRTPLPGHREPAKPGARAAVDERVTKAERILFGRGKGTCTECHRFETPDGAVDEVKPGTPIAAVQVEPTYIPTIWYERAVFDHSAHRAVSCRDCHAAAYPDAKTPSRTSASVLLPGKATCAQCHAPAASDSAGNAVGGAGHACTECHRYHGGSDHAGPSMARDADAMDIKQFLLGISGEKTKSNAKPKDGKE